MKDLLQKAKPISFNTEMVKAILDGIKTQTRRPIKSNIKKDNETHSLNGAVFTIDNKLYFEHNLIKNFSQYKVGDILWVREPAKIIGNHKQIGNIYERTCNFKYLADDKIIEDFNIPYRFSSLHINQFLYKNLKGTWLTGNKSIPNGCIKEMARIFLKVTNVRVERLQDISLDDIKNEGLSHNETQLRYGVSIEKQLRRDWINLWNATAKDGYKWEDNPYVFVYEFERVEVC